MIRFVVAAFNGHQENKGINMTASLFPKKDFDFDADVNWFMHCAEGPVPHVSIEAMRQFLVKESKPWKVDFIEDFEVIPQSVKMEAAKLIGVLAEDISITATTSAGLVLVAQGMTWQAGDEILLPVGEFPSNIWPWKALENQGVVIREIPLWENHFGGEQALETEAPSIGQNCEENLLKAITPQTRVIAVSWVRFQDGLKLNLKRLADGCKAANVALVVDGIQGVGTLPTMPDGVSAFASGAHKGLLTPQGSGFLWTNADFRAQLKPLGSWLSVEDATNFNRPNSDSNRSWNRDGSYLEQGVPNLVGCAGFNASLKYINGFTTEACYQHIRSLQKELLDGLSHSNSWRDEVARLLPLHQEHRLGSILAFFFGRRTKAAETLLKAGFEKGIYTSIREGYLRIALHGWHHSNDIQQLLSWMA